MSRSGWSKLWIVGSIVLSLAFTWLGLAIAYYSPHPVSFFITSLAFATYVIVRVIQSVGDRRSPATHA